MSDAFADLWSTTNPAAKPKAPLLSSAASNSTSNSSRPGSSKPDVFSLLAGTGSGSGSGTSTPRYNSRPITPSVGGVASARATPIPQQKVATKQGNDAFGDLFSSSSDANGSGNMTLAARLAMQGAAQRKDATSTELQTTGGGSSSAWAGLDALAGGLTAVPVPLSTAGQGDRTKRPVIVDDVDDWGLSDFGHGGSTTRKVESQPPKTQTQPKIQTQSKKGASLWDLDDFATATGLNDTPSDHDAQPAPSRNERSPYTVALASPDKEFDFGGREDRVDEERWEHRTKDKLLDLWDDERAPESARGLLDSGHDEDDVLGMLSKPVEVVKAQHTQNRATPPKTEQRSTSPPPHVIGQIVEMGFSVQQARIALAQTATGLDVAAAIESLLNENTAPPTSATPLSREPPHSEPPPTPRSRGAPKGQKERERRERLRASGEGATSSATPTPSVADIQEQADKLLAQASEIGLSVFSKASAMWGKSKERVVKAYEERAAASSSGLGDVSGSRGAGRPARVDGRPKWMQEAVGDHEDEHVGEKHRSTFRDQDVVFETTEEGPSLHIPDIRQAPVHEEVDLFSDAPVVSKTQRPAEAATTTGTRTVPPQRRPIPTRQPSSTPSLRSTPAPSIPERTLPAAPPAALTTTLKHKTTGTEQFKLGQYAAATEAYTAAIDVLPQGHLLLVPLYTNRALARIRCGDYKAAEDDCAQALAIVVDDGDSATGKGKSLVWAPSRLPPSLLPAAGQTSAAAWTHPQGRGVDLADGYVKALKRRAEALEGREKWEAAAADWEVLAGCAWASEGVRRDAVRGRGRCKGMDGANADSNSGASANGTGSAGTKSAPPAPKPKPKPRPTPASTAPSGALRALQSQNAQAEADDALKFSLKDGVDARLAAWRQGREGNIRALLVGLDAVLWDGALEGVRVRGLHELVSPVQVKKGYVRVIGRVHPDKLNTSNSTVEQRMLANGVFGTLNEAWISFQATQK